jgi:hypothetical protein
MTLNMQRDIVIGALCSDQTLRNAVFASADLDAVRKRLADYAHDAGLTLDAQVIQDVWKLIENPERDDFFGGCRILFCRVWPCR